MLPPRLELRFLACALCICIAATASCAAATSGDPSPASGDDAVSATPLPDIPANQRHVEMIDGASVTTPGEFLYPAIPPLRTSADGRIGVNLKEPHLTVDFYLVAPEKLTVPFFSAASPAGVNILASTTPLSLAPSELLGTSPYQQTLRHTTICDATAPHLAKGGRPNPYGCGATGTSDCYDLTVIGSAEFTDGGVNKVQLWGTHLTVQVDSPKTAGAKMSIPFVDTPIAGPILTVNTMLEMMTTDDGHLLVARLSDTNLQWDDKTTPHTNIAYLVGQSTDAPCDVQQWQQPYPVSHAFADPDMAGYGFAEYQLRDPEGNLLSDGVELKGTYPWIDRAGRNLFFYTIDADLYYASANAGDLGTVRTRYPAECVTPGCTFPTTEAAMSGYEESSNTRGLSVAGRWTHGKIVMLDGQLNNIDYGLPVVDSRQRDVALYAPDTGPNGGDQSGLLRLGTGRDNDSPAVAWPPGATTNSTFVDSLENLFNYNAILTPLTPRDVVWIVNNGRGSDEVAFDDMLDVNGFIVSEMTGSLTWSNGNPNGGTALDNFFTYYDGFDRKTHTEAYGFDGELPIHFQNSATAVSSRWAIPRYGLATGNARLEPAAEGGIRGKGLWLDGASGVTYAIPSPQPASLAGIPWFFSVFVDSRSSDDGAERRLLTFPDGSTVFVQGRSQVVYADAHGNPTATIPLHGVPLAYQGFTHLAILVDNPGGKVGLFVNGYLFDERAIPALSFQMVAGASFSLGALTGGSDGFVGWVDELKVLAERPNVEVICNHARGTLAGVDATSGALAALAGLYPQTSHDAITQTLESSTPPQSPTYTRYVCWHDYSRDIGAYVGNIPGGANGGTTIRRNINFPEGPLHYDLPRPESSKNAFCSTCHDAGQSAPLNQQVLVMNPSIDEENDARRQPLQPPPRVFGNVPKNYIGPGVPKNAVPQPLPPGGTDIDPAVYP